jgi:hypothetical protein
VIGLVRQTMSTPVPFATLPHVEYQLLAQRNTTNLKSYKFVRQWMRNYASR